MPRSTKNKASELQPDLFDLTLFLRTAPCVPALRKLVAEWKAGGYAGVTRTTRSLLNYWFSTDHRLSNGQLFQYHDAQREAIETLIYVYEVAKVRSRKDLLEKYVPPQSELKLSLPSYDEFARYCTKMATGSGKTKVMSLAIAWQYFNAVREDENDYAKTFLIIAPNVIVLERLKSDFEGGRIFVTDPIIPRELKISWELDCVMRGDAERAPADIDEAKSNIASVRYQGYLTAGVERWREYREQLAPLNKKPLLFIMMNTTEDADDVGTWLSHRYPAEFGGEDRTLIIHTNREGDISKKDLDRARKLAREVDDPDCPTNAIVSVLMLREQAIGRGLRLMFRGKTYSERVDIIGNKAFLTFVDELEKLEDIQLETFEVGKDKLKIISISPQMPEKAAYDLSLPRITPVLVRKKSLHAEIEGLDVRNFTFSPDPLPRKPTIADIKKFQYEAFDILTMEKIFEREYAIKDAQRPDEIVSYYAKVIASNLKLPGQFAALAPRVWQFFEERAFGAKVDLYNSAIIQAMNHRVAAYVVLDVFAKALREKLIEQVEPDIEGADRMLSSMEPFAFSRPVLEARKCVFNMVPCDNDFEYAFARFLDSAQDVLAFSKLPQQFGFSIEYTDNNANLRYYYPDFVVKTTANHLWLVETKGQESIEVRYKDTAARMWCENVSTLTGQPWRYIKVPQKEYRSLQPVEFEDLLAFSN